MVASGDSELCSISVLHAATLAELGPAINPPASRRLRRLLLRLPGFALAPDGRSVVSASDQGELVWWDLETRKATRRLEIGADHLALALSPDGRTAAVGAGRGIQLVDTRTGTARTATGVLGGAPSWLLFSPDGKTVVSTSLDGTVALWDVESATLRETLRGHSRAAQQPVFGPDAKMLYTASHDGTAIAWDVAASAGWRHFRFTRDLTPDPAGFDGHPGIFSPDGRLAAVGLKDEGIRLWDTDLVPAGPPLEQTSGEVWALDFSQDGRTLAAVTVAVGQRCGTSSRSPLRGRSRSDVATFWGSTSARTARCSPRPDRRREALGLRNRGSAWHDRGRRARR